MRGLRDHVSTIVGAIIGVLPYTELRNTVLTVYFLKHALASEFTNPKIEGIKLLSNKVFSELRNSYRHRGSQEFMLKFMSILEMVVLEQDHLYAVFKDLNMERTTMNSPDAVYSIYRGLFEEEYLDAENYKDGFNEIVQLFSEKEGNQQSVFNTPSSIKEIYKGIIGNVDSILDPTCGTGSLLDMFDDENTRKVVGQDLDRESVAIARLRFAFEPAIQLEIGNSFTHSKLNYIKTDAVVINPPINLKIPKDSWVNPDYLLFGKPPRSNANMLWLQLAISHIEENGKALVLLSNSSLSSSGHEGEIRKAIVREGWVEAIISLPSGVFSYTSVSTSIWVLSKGRQDGKEILLIDISDSLLSHNRYRKEIPTKVISQLSACYNSFKNGHGLDALTPFQASIKSVREIAQNDYSLSPVRYLPIEGLDDYDLSYAVELRNLISIEKSVKWPTSKQFLVKNLSIKDLSSSTDKYEIDVDAIDIIEKTKGGKYSDGDVLLIARSGEKLKPSYLPARIEEVPYSLMNIHSFKVNDNMVRMDYLIQELNKKYVQLQVSKFRSGSAIANLNAKDFLKLKINLPSLIEEQEQLVNSEKEIRFESLAKMHGFESEIDRLKEQWRLDLGSKRHNIMQHLNNVKSSSDVLHKMLRKNNGTLRANDLIDPRKSVTVQIRMNRLSESIDRVLFYAVNLPNDIRFEKLGLHDASSIVKECVEKGVQEDNFVFKDNSDLEALKLQKPIISVSIEDFEELYNNILENARSHGFVEDKKYEFRYSVLLEKEQVILLFENNGKPFPKGMGTIEAYSTRGEKAGKTANTGEGSWKVCQIAEHFGATIEILDEPTGDFPVGIKLIFNLVQ